MVAHRIGEKAGRIWHTLAAEGQPRVSALKKRLDASDPLIYMALGWLAREDKLELEPEARTFRIRLK